MSKKKKLFKKMLNEEVTKTCPKRQAKQEYFSIE